MCAIFMGESDFSLLVKKCDRMSCDVYSVGLDPVNEVWQHQEVNRKKKWCQIMGKTF